MSEIAVYATEVYNSVCEEIASLNKVGARLEVLTLSGSLEGARWRSLTMGATTRISDRARLFMLSLFALLQKAYADAVALRGDMSAIHRIYYRGQASVNYLTVNMAFDVILLPVTSVLGELSIVYSSIQQLLSYAQGGVVEQKE